MNTRLLDTRVSEAAVTRPPTMRRWGHRSDRNQPATVATVVAAATKQARVKPALPARHLAGVRRTDDTPLDFSDLLDDPKTCPDWAVPPTIEENIAAILAAVAAAPFTRHEDALTMALAPIVTLLDEPVEEFWYDNRLDRLAGLHADTMGQLTWLTTTAVRALDAIANVDAFATHQLHAEFAEPLDALDAELVDAYAALIRAEASL